eukprot:12644-Heterococcus_DN1.PRE.2
MAHTAIAATLPRCSSVVAAVVQHVCQPSVVLHDLVLRTGHTSAKHEMWFIGALSTPYVLTVTNAYYSSDP